MSPRPPGNPLVAAFRASFLGRAIERGGSHLAGLWDPAGYHGHGKRRDFFEGWYFKLVDPTEQHVWSIIPGVFLGARPETSHCFVQTLDGKTGASSYHRYPLAAFGAARRGFDITVGPNRFTATQIELDLHSPARRISGALTFAGVTPWPVTPLSPGIMGPYAFTPFMECYHGVVSLDHTISGRLSIDGRQVDFTGGRGYTEKDWGQAFPSAWIWTQSNHFEQAGTSLTASIAVIPWLRGSFPGFITGFWHDRRLYRFATYTGAVTERLQITGDRVVWTMRGRALGRRGPLHRLEVTAHRSEGGLIHAPSRTDMVQRVAESLTAGVEVRLLAIEGNGERILFEGHGRHAGLELGGQVERLARP